MTHSGAGFGGLTRYLLQGEKDNPNPDRVLWTSTRELTLEDPQQTAILMRATAAQGRTDKPVQHLSISLPPDEHLTRDQWEQVIDTTLRDLGLEGNQALIVAHRDTAHERIHLLVNRVHPETLRAWDRWQDRPRLSGNRGCRTPPAI
jgi:Relaxase/Mobilisation nuclease domain